MHIVGLLGMPRRVYTYAAGLGWGAYNLVETIGALRARGRAAPDPREPRLEPLPRRSRRARPVPRRHARVDDHLAAARLQLRRHPDRLERVSELGRADRPRTCGGSSAASSCSTRATRRRRRPSATADLDEVLEMPAESPWPIVARGLRRRSSSSFAARRPLRRSPASSRRSPRSPSSAGTRGSRGGRARDAAVAARTQRAATAERLVGHGALRRDRGDAVRDDLRHLRSTCASRRRSGRRADRARAGR